jgi:hypothetical protein
MLGQLAADVIGNMTFVSPCFTLESFVPRRLFSGCKSVQ